MLQASSLNDFITQGSSPLPSPASTIESLTRELEHSLDVNNSNKKTYNNQTNEKTSHHSVNSLLTSSKNNINGTTNGTTTNTNNYNNGVLADKFRNGTSLSRSNTTMRSLDLWMATKGTNIFEYHFQINIDLHI